MIDYRICRMRLIALLLACLATAVQAQTFRSDDHDFRLVRVVERLDQPWSLAFLPDGRMLVTEKEGRLRIVSGGRLQPRGVSGLPPVTVHGQGGLFDVV